MPPPLPDDPEARPPAHVLNYSPLWMDAVFRPRSRAEALLSPEREAGNLTPQDYDTTIDFLSNYHRQYPIIFGALGFALIMPFRNPKWNQSKRIATGCAFALGGYTVGQVSFLSAHFNYLRSIEKPHGFQKAMENIQAQIGSPKGPAIQRVYELSPDDMDPDQALANMPQLTLPKASDNAPSDPPAPAPRTKWDEIRTANNRGAQNSSWDKLRQSHERKDIKSVEITGDGDVSSEKVDNDPYDNPRRR